MTDKKENYFKTHWQSCNHLLKLMKFKLENISNSFFTRYVLINSLAYSYRAVSIDFLLIISKSIMLEREVFFIKFRFLFSNESFETSFFGVRLADVVVEKEAFLIALLDVGDLG